LKNHNTNTLLVPGAPNAKSNSKRYQLSEASLLKFKNQNTSSMQNLSVKKDNRVNMSKDVDYKETILTENIYQDKKSVVNVNSTKSLLESLNAKKRLKTPNGRKINRDNPSLQKYLVQHTRNINLH